MRWPEGRAHHHEGELAGGDCRDGVLNRVHGASNNRARSGKGAKGKHRPLFSPTGVLLFLSPPRAPPAAHLLYRRSSFEPGRALTFPIHPLTPAEMRPHLV